MKTKDECECEFQKLSKLLDEAQLKIKEWMKDHPDETDDAPDAIAGMLWGACQALSWVLGTGTSVSNVVEAIDITADLIFEKFSQEELEEQEATQ